MENDNVKSSESIKVSVRVRPLNSRELEHSTSQNDSWSFEETTITQVHGGRPIPSASFAFDHLFLPGSTNEQVYDAIGHQHAASVVDGYNSVIFAYGQTSSGKTHTMMGTDSDSGVTPRAVNDLFNTIAEAHDRNFYIRVSYLEIYNEVIRDLLAPRNDNLKIHEDWSGRVFVESMEQVVGSADQVLEIMRQGEENRTFGATNMNERSSRSHTIFALNVQSTLRTTEEQNKEDGVAVRQGVLSLVDLAGSERVSLTGAEGVRLKEGGHINKSLMVLGNVISKLSEGNTSHVPYRDSKLTRVLQNALGGNAKTSIVCAVTPADMHVEETLSTLKFASRAKKVKNTTQCNELLDDRALVKRQQKEIARLRALVGSGAESSFASPADSEKVATLEGKLRKLSSLLQVAQSLHDTQVTGPSRPRKRRSLPPPSDMELSNRPTRNTNELSETVRRLNEEVLQACKRAKKAENERDHAKTVAGYEVEALKNEIDRLGASAVSLELRAIASQEDADNAGRLLSVAVVTGLVDTMVTDAMSVAEMSRTHSEIDEITEKQTTMRTELETTAGELREKRKELSEALRREKLGVGPVLKEANLLRSKVQDLEAKNRSSRQTISTLQQQQAQLQREVKEAQRQTKVQQAEATKNRESVQKVKEALTAASTAGKRADVLEKENRRIAEAIRQAEQQLNEAKLERDRLEGELQSCQSQKSEQASQAGTDLASLARSLEDKTNELTTLTQSAAAVQKELDDTRLQLSEKEASYIEASERCASLTSRLADCEEQIGPLGDENESLRGQIADLTLEVTEVSGERDKSRALASEHEAKLSDLAELLANATASRDTTRASLNELEEKYKRLEQELTVRTCSSEELRTTSEKNRSSAEGLRCELAAIRNENESMSLQLTEALLRIEELQSLSEQKEEALARLRTQYDHATAQRTAEAAEASKAHDDAEEIIATLRQRVMTLESQQREHRVRSESLEEQLTVVNRKLEGTRRALEKSHTECVTLEAARQEAAVQLSELKNSSEERQEVASDEIKRELGTARDEISKLKHELRERSEQLRQCFERLTLRDKEMQDYRGEVQNKQRMYDSRLDQRNSQVRVLKHQLRALESKAIDEGDDGFFWRNTAAKAEAELRVSRRQLSDSERKVEELTATYDKFCVETRRLRERIKEMELEKLALESRLLDASMGKDKENIVPSSQRPPLPP